MAKFAGDDVDAPSGLPHRFLYCSFWMAEFARIGGGGEKSMGRGLCETLAVSGIRQLLRSTDKRCQDCVRLGREHGAPYFWVVAIGRAMMRDFVDVVRQSSRPAVGVHNGQPTEFSICSDLQVTTEEKPTIFYFDGEDDGSMIVFNGGPDPFPPPLT